MTSRKNLSKEEEPVEETPSNLSPITHDFHREDLNELRDKVNELESLIKK